MKILISFEGGGVKGVQSAIYAEFLEHVTGRPISQIADLTVGTSTGALAAVATTAAIPLSGAQLVDLYTDKSKEIFSRPWHRPVTTLGGLLAPKYDNYNLLKVAQEAVGAGPLAGAKSPVMTTSYNLVTRRPTFHKSWDSDGVSAVFAAAASAMAPTFFAPLNGHCDGGLFANDPTLCGVVELMRLHKIPASEIAVLTFGTGSSDRPIRNSNMTVTSIGDIVDCFMDGSEGVVQYQAEALGLGAYLRLEAPDGANPRSGMDDASKGNLATLEAIARKVVMHNTQALLNWLDKVGIK